MVFSMEEGGWERPVRISAGVKLVIYCFAQVKIISKIIGSHNQKKVRILVELEISKNFTINFDVYNY